MSKPSKSSKNASLPRVRWVKVFRWWSQRYQMIPTMAFLSQLMFLGILWRRHAQNIRKIGKTTATSTETQQLILGRCVEDHSRSFFRTPWHQPGITNDPSANIYHQPGRAGFVLDVTRCCAKVAFNVAVVEILWVHLHVAALLRFLRGWYFCAAKGFFMLWWKHHRGRLWKKLDKLMKNDDGD